MLESVSFIGNQIAKLRRRKSTPFVLCCNIAIVGNLLFWFASFVDKNVVQVYFDGYLPHWIYFTSLKFHAFLLSTISNSKHFSRLRSCGFSFVVIHGPWHKSHYVRTYTISNAVRIHCIDSQLNSLLQEKNHTNIRLNKLSINGFALSKTGNFSHTRNHYRHNWVC